MWYLQFHFVCAKLFVMLDCSFIFSSDWVYFVVGRPLISYPIGGFLSTSSAEPLLNSRDYRGVFVDTKRRAALPRSAPFFLSFSSAFICPYI